MIKKNILLILLSLLAFSAFGGGKNSENSDVLTVATSADYPPFESIEKNEFVGFDIELAREIGKRLNKKVEFKDMDFTSVIESVRSKRVDLALSAVSITPERQKNVNFSDPYYVPKMVILIRKDDKSLNARIQDRSMSMQQLKSKVVGASTGTAMYMMADEYSDKFDFEVRVLDSTPNLYVELTQGKIDAVIIESIQADTYASKGLSTYALIPDNEVLEELKEGYGIVFNKDSTMIEQVNAILAELESSGFLYELEQKWVFGK